MKTFRSIAKFDGARRMDVVYPVLILLLLALFTLPVLAQESLYFSVKQGADTYDLTPLERAGPVAEFYDYSDDEAHTGLEVSDSSILFLYRDTTTGELYLVIIHDQPDNGSGGEVEFSFEGLPGGATIVLRDDPNAQDSYEFAPPEEDTAFMHWQWVPEHTDGVVIGGLGQEFSITITPNFISGIDEWHLVTGSVANPIYTKLASLADPLTIIATTNIPPQASFTFSPTVVNVGQAVSFDASASSDPDGFIREYDWDFGDGTTASGVAVSHTYGAAGSYVVSLTVTDNQGATNTVTRTVTVSEAVVEATRRISTPAVLPGSTFRVVVEISTSTEIEGLGLDEDLPGGWEINPIDNAGAAFKRVDTQWIWARTIRAGETIKIVYDVTVPEELVSGPLPVEECITGAIDSAQPAFHKEVGGDSCLKVDRCLPIIVAIAHLDPETEEIDLTLPNDVTAAQLQLATSYWLEDEAVPGTCGNLIDLETLKVVIAHYLKSTPVDEPLPEEPGNQAANVTRQILTPLPFHQLYLEAYRGNIFKVVVTIEANRDLHGLGLDENLPQSWQIKQINSAGGIFKEPQSQWAFPEKIPAGTSKRITYEVTVPPGSVYCLDEGCKANVFELSGSADSANPQFEVPVGGDREVVIAKCLSIPIAVAFLDVETNTIDATLSSKITFEQIQAAIAFWLEDEAVPGTCDKTIDFGTMKLLIAYWLTDTPVDLPLGVSPEDP